MIKVSHAFISSFVKECYSQGLSEESTAELLEKYLRRADESGSASSMRDMMRRAAGLPEITNNEE